MAAVYDVNRRDSFDNLNHWLQEVEVYSAGGGREIVKLLVGNKVDKVGGVEQLGGETWSTVPLALCPSGRPSWPRMRGVTDMVVGTTLQERLVTREEAEAWARSKGMLFLEASAKTRVGIKQVFNEVIQKVRTSKWWR